MTVSALLVSYAFPPSASPGALRAERLVRRLPQWGWRCNVLTVGKAARMRSRVDLNPAKDDPHGILRIDDPLAVFETRGALQSGTSGRQILRRLGQALIFPDRTIFWALKLRGARDWVQAAAPNVVLSTSPSLSSHLAGHMMARTIGAKWVAEFRDPVSWLPRQNPTSKFKRFLLARLEKWVVSRADAVVVVSEAFAEYFRALYPDCNIHSIPNGAEFDDARIRSTMVQREMRHKTAQARPLVLVHAGELYNGERNPSPIIEAAILAQRSVLRPIRLRFIGRDSHLAKEVAIKLGASDMVESIGPLNHVDSVRETEASDGLVALLHDDPVARIGIMSKFFDYIATSNPILVVGDRQATLSRVVEDEGLGSACEYTDMAGMANWIIRLANDPSSFDYDAVHVCRQWSADEMARAMAKLFDSLCAQP